MMDTWRNRVAAHGIPIPYLAARGVLLSPGVELQTLSGTLHASRHKALPQGSVLLSYPLRCIWSSDARRCPAHLNITDALALQLEKSASEGDEYALICKNLHPARFYANLPFLDNPATALETARWRQERASLDRALHAERWSISAALRCGVGFGGDAETLLAPFLYELVPHEGCRPASALALSAGGRDGLLLNLLAGVPQESLDLPYLHLVALRTIESGSAVTRCYMPLAPNAPEARDAWRVAYGFVPEVSEKDQSKILTFDELDEALFRAMNRGMRRFCEIIDR